MFADVAVSGGSHSFGLGTIVSCYMDLGLLLILQFVSPKARK